MSPKRLRPMKSTPLTFLGSLLLLSLSGGSLRAQETLVSPVAGFLKFECPGGSDTRVSVPFHPVAKWAGALASAPTNPGGGLVRLTVAIPAAIPVGEFSAAPHYLLCREPSAAEGRHFEIVAQDATTIDVVADLADFAGLGAGGKVEVFPAWTLDTLFPPGQQGVFHPSTGRLATGRGSELLFFNGESRGTQLAPSRRFFLNEDGWIEVGTFSPAGEEVIAPGSSFIVRHPDGAATTTFTAIQQVYAGPVRIPVRTSMGVGQDSVAAPPRPVPLALGELDLGGLAFVESVDSDPANRGDELHVFDNLATGINKAASAVYFRIGGQWIEDVPGFPVADLTEVEPSAGLLLRKASGAADLLLHWVDLPTYDVINP